MNAVIGKVIRTQDSDDGVEVVVAVEGDDNNLVTADHLCAPGVDARPIPGDYAQLTAFPGDRWTVIAYDMVEVAVAKDGEVLVMSRDPKTGKKSASIHLATNGNINLNGLVIDKDGNLHTPGEITTAKGGTDINLSDHIHLHSMGPTKGPSSPPSV
jgi:hypothetical protein